VEDHQTIHLFDSGDKKMKLLLVNPPFERQEGNIWKIVSSSMPPLGLAIVAASAEKEGFAVKILDLPAEGLWLDDFKNYLRQEKFDWIGFTATTLVIKNALALAQIAKAECPQAQVVFGGVHASIFPAEVLAQEYVDYVITGEGEHSLVDLLRGRDRQEIGGLYYKENGVVKNNPPAPLIPDLDQLPYPAYHLLPMKKYHPALGGYKRLPAISMLTSRGCPGICTFCYKQMFGSKTRYRSAPSLVSEIEYLIAHHGIREIVFYDDTFTVHKDNVRKFCELLISKKINLTWSCMSRIDCIDENLLILMKQAGCHQICYGVESADEQVLKNIKKNISLAKVEKVCQATKKAGIDLRLAFMLGNPGDTEASMNRTIDLALRLKPDLVQFNITTPYPGTEMFNWAKAHKYLITYHWEDYDLSRAVMDLPEAPAALVEKYYKLAYRRFYFRRDYMLGKIVQTLDPGRLLANVKAFIRLLRMI
jgi:anaerobic magnesium-protoporphyrin IX monomethyl ester cyclase